MLTPDGRRYLAMGAGRRVCLPFHLRWLVPFVCRESYARWRVVSLVSLAAVAVLVAVFVGTPWAAAVVALPGLDFNRRHPVLVDAPGLALALLAAVLWPVAPWAAVAVACVAGMVRESAPVWAAVFAWSVWPLLGLVPVVLRWSMRQGEDPCGYGAVLRRPLRSALEAHRGRWLDPAVMVAPWGGLLVAAGNLSPRVAVALAVGYGQLLVATDSVRLYQWAAPVVAVAAFGAVPPAWHPLLALSIVGNPWKGDGL